MSYRCAIRNNKPYLVLDEPMNDEPVMRSFFWPLPTR